MDIKQLEYFITVVEEGTITGAAKKLHISQPPLSAQMQILEEELGAKLFQRGARQIILTEPGRMLYKKALEMRDLSEQAKEEIRTWKKGQAGHLRLGLVSSSSCEELYQKLALFQKLYPEIQIKVYEGNTYELLEMLHREKIDAAVLRTPFSFYGLDTAFIHQDSMALLGFKDEKAVNLKDLKGHPLILYRRWEKLILDAFEEIEIKPHVYCVADDARTCVSWARAGLGVAMVPESALLETGLSYQVLEEGNLISELRLARKREGTSSMASELLFELFERK